MRRIQEASELRLLTLWTKVRESNDVNVVKETIEILSDFYKIASYTMDDAKQTRLKREMEDVYTRDIPYLVSKWPLLKVLGLQLSMLVWMRFKGKSLSYLDQLFKTKEDLEGEFLEGGDLYSLLEETKSNLVVRTVIRNLWTKFEGAENQNVTLENLFDLVKSKGIYTIMISHKDLVSEYVVQRKRGESYKAAYNRVFKEYCQKNIGSHARWNKNTASWWTRGGVQQTKKKQTGLNVPWPGKPLILPANQFHRYPSARLDVIITEHIPALDFRFEVNDSVLNKIISSPSDAAAERLFRPSQWVDLPTQELVNGLRQFAFTNIPREIQPFLEFQVYVDGWDVGDDELDDPQDYESFEGSIDEYDVDGIWTKIVNLFKERWANWNIFRVGFYIDKNYDVISDHFADKNITPTITEAIRHIELLRKYIDPFSWNNIYNGLRSIPYSDEQGAEWAKLFPTVQDFKVILQKTEILKSIFGSPPFDYKSKPNFWNAMFKKTFEQQFELAK